MDKGIFPDQREFLKDLDNILQRLEFGLPSSALALTKLSVHPTRGQCLLLLATDEGGQSI